MLRTPFTSPKEDKDGNILSDSISGKGGHIGRREDELGDEMPPAVYRRPRGRREVLPAGDAGAHRGPAREVGRFCGEQCPIRPLGREHLRGRGEGHPARIRHRDGGTVPFRDDEEGLHRRPVRDSRRLPLHRGELAHVPPADGLPGSRPDNLRAFGRLPRIRVDGQARRQAHFALRRHVEFLDYEERLGNGTERDRLQVGSPDMRPYGNTVARIQQGLCPCILGEPRRLRRQDRHGREKDAERREHRRPCRRDLHELLRTADCRPSVHLHGRQRNERQRLHVRIHAHGLQGQLAKRQCWKT